MKKSIVLVLLLACALSFAIAEGTMGEPHASVGDLMVSAGANIGWGSFGVGGGAEYIVARWDIPEFAPLTFGGAAKASMYFGSSTHIDLAALGTIHFGLKTFENLPGFLKNLDWYYGLGIGFGIGTSGGLGISTGSGISYYLNNKLALNADYFYTDYFGSGSGSSSTLGVKLEL